MLREGGAAELPVLEARRDHRRNVLLGTGVNIAESELFNVCAVFVIAYCVDAMGLSRQVVLNGVLPGCVVECVTLPPFGALSDRIGRRAVYVGGMACQAVFAWPFCMLLASGQVALIYLAITLGLTPGHGSVRGGGLSAIIATARLAEYGGTSPIALYMAGMAMLSAACALALRFASGCGVPSWPERHLST